MSDSKTHKKQKFVKYFAFSPQRKIIVMSFLVLFIASLIFILIPMNGGAGWGNIGAWFPSMYFFALLIITYNLENLKKIFRKAYKLLIFIFYFGMILYFVAFSIFCILILGYNSNDIPENPDVVIVLGCHVYGYTPGNLLRYRLETTVETLNKYPNAICIVSGGQGAGETVRESATMKKYLADNGIDENKIYEEGESYSSFTNLSFSKKIIDENNLKYKNIVIVTSEYHIPRAVLIAHRVYPNANIYAVKSHSPFALFSAGIVREFFAFIKSFLVDKV